MPLSSSKSKRVISSDFDAHFQKHTERLLAGDYTHHVKISRDTVVAGDAVSITFDIIPPVFKARIVERSTGTRRRSEASERNERRVVVLATYESQAPAPGFVYIGMKKGDYLQTGTLDGVGAFTADGQLYEVDSVRPNKDHAVYVEALKVD